MKAKLPEAVVFLFNAAGEVLLVHGDCPRLPASRITHRTFENCVRHGLQRLAGIKELDDLQKLGVYSVPPFRHHDHVIAYVGLCRNPPPLSASARFRPETHALLGVPQSEPWLNIVENAVMAAKAKGLRVQ